MKESYRRAAQTSRLLALDYDWGRNDDQPVQCRISVVSTVSGEEDPNVKQSIREQSG